MNIEFFKTVNKEFLSFYLRFIANDRTEKMKEEVFHYYYRLFEPLNLQDIQSMSHVLEPNRSNVFWYGQHSFVTLLSLETTDGSTYSIQLADYESSDEPYIEVFTYRGVEVEPFIAHDAEELREKLTQQIIDRAIPKYLTDEELEDMEYEYVNTRFLKLDVDLSDGQRMLLEEKKDGELLDYINHELGDETFTCFYEVIDCLVGISNEMKE